MRNAADYLAHIKTLIIMNPPYNGRILLGDHYDRTRST
jgi:hypothetical protein